MSNDSIQHDDSVDQSTSDSGGGIQLERGTYEIIRSRLNSHSQELATRLESLNEIRRDVFGSIPTELISNQRITTVNNCTARDIVAVGNRLIFGYNVMMGLKSVITVADVFSAFSIDEDGNFHLDEFAVLSDTQFLRDFSELYKYYKGTSFSKFQVIGAHLYMVFQVGKTARDIKAFKFLMSDGHLSYVDARSDHEVQYPPQHDFKWIRTHRDLHRSGEHPHISIDDRVFVETVGGDLTIKVEDNTEDGEGIYREPVLDPDQTLDDAEIFYSIVGNLILMKIRPFREDEFRYFVFNEKLQTALRLDSIANACILLPEDHGLIFSNGYYLQNGQYKTFESQIDNLLFEKRIPAANGEDFLNVFFQPESGHYVLLSYNMIEQAVSTPIICNGYSLFENGRLVYFKADEAPQKHHAIQIWQTPYVTEVIEPVGNKDSYVFKIGNREIVRAMAESKELVSLINQEDSYANLYVDVVKKSTDILDSYFWLNDSQTAKLSEPLSEIKKAATAAVDEFDKVVRVRKSTNEQFAAASKAARDAISSAASRQKRSIDDYVQSLAELRLVRGQVISLKELKYIDHAAVETLEQEIVDNTGRLSHQCVEYLIREDSLKPYADRVSAQRADIESLETGVKAKELGEEISDTGTQLEMLIDIVSNLRIDDANQRTQIIDNISTIYSSLNQTRATLKKKSQELMAVEGAAEFNSQLKLLSQAVVNYLDVCDSPEKCDEYLTKMMVQVEEIEGRFAEFDEYVIQLADKREEIYAAFDSKKIQLNEARNRRATALMSAADRILKGIKSRVSNFDSVDAINSYFASDMMIEKVRDIIEELERLEESVKIDDVQSRLKTTREDAVRQLRDKNELFVDGQNIIQFGEYKFSVNVQPLDLTTVIKDGEMFFHLSGTNFFEEIDDEALLTTKDVWEQSVVSENRDVYRGEYLVRKILKASIAGTIPGPKELLGLAAEELEKTVQQFMAPRYSDGYIKGVHDHDAAKILHELLNLHQNLNLLKYSPDSRALAHLFWYASDSSANSFKKSIVTQLSGLAAARNLFGDDLHRTKYISKLLEHIAPLASAFEWPEARSERAANYLFDLFTGSSGQVCSTQAHALCVRFREFLKKKNASADFEAITSAKKMAVSDQYLLVRQWLESFVEQSGQLEWGAYLNESAAMIMDGTETKRHVVEVQSVLEIEGMLGDHSRTDGGRYRLDYHDFTQRLDHFETETVVAFDRYHEVKKEVVEGRRDSLRLEEFEPRVLTSFVRNKLINDVYLPMVGANLAKQMGVVGDEKRTDLMGLLLLISPPGYGKTTLMEYIANRLGITFMKINGPAIGHQVTSLDPNEAPNASAREEIQKLNLSLEMGDNVMIYLDDIQHCNPEFLQKFISLCDATRRIEGVFNGKTRTYDLRGRKVCVIMAGNPYTESGDKFQIPDMLANRADTYNLGDVIGDTQDAFELSYLENCLTSNPALSRLNSQSRNDIYTIVKMAGQAEPEVASLEGNYSIEEINEFVAVMKKLLVVRNAILKVNLEYIESAAQADDYRTEPPFKLQGSYRDMNKMAERIASIMNDDELNTLLLSHYENQAQTLTTGAEANLLKFKELMGTLTDDEAQRWEDIKRTFKRNLLLGSASKDDQIGQVIAQMTTFSEGLYDIRKALETGAGKIASPKIDEGQETMQTATLREVGHAVVELAKFNQSLVDIKELLGEGIATRSVDDLGEPVRQNIEIVNKVPNAFLNVLRNQFRVMQTWMGPILDLAEIVPEAKGLKSAAKATEKNYRKILDKIEDIHDEELSKVDDDFDEESAE